MVLFAHLFLPLLHHPFGAAAPRVRPLGPWQAGAFRATGSISQSVAPSSSPAATGPACPAPCVCQRDSSCVTYASSVSTNPISLNKCSQRRKLNMYIQKDLNVRHLVSYSVCILSASFLPASRTFLHFPPHNMFLLLSRQLSATCF